MMSLLTSCNIGVKTKTVVVFSSPFRIVQAKGMTVIATNKKIRVVIDSKHVTKIDLGGMYVISPAQLQALKKQLETNRRP